MVDKDGSGLIELTEFEVVMNNISLDMGMKLPSSSDIRTIFNTWAFLKFFSRNDLSGLKSLISKESSSIPNK